ncbi:MAG: flavodoxin family protein [Odoribacter sp.]|nr:flavodoxin family protein [Odoribacter sp.]
MEIIIINGSPRHDGNTVRMCRAFAEGAESSGKNISTRMIHLCDLEFKGCRSCFACKLKGGKSYGTCAVKDALSPVLERVKKADALVLASPVYFMDVTGTMRSFLERLLFPLATYEAGYRTIALRRMPVVMIYTMNVPREMAPLAMMDDLERFVGHVFSPPRRLCAYNTYQFNDYSKYIVEVFSEADKRRYRDNIFPQELRAAEEMGREI